MDGAGVLTEVACKDERPV